MLWLLGIFGTIKAILTMLALGAGVGAVSWAAGKFIPGLWTSFIIACALGAAVVTGTGGAGYFKAADQCANEARLNEMRFENARLEQELEAAKAAAAVQDDVLAEQAHTLADNEAVLDKLRAAISNHADDDECVLNPDELEAIGDIK